jgi:Cysteine-rich secretory protein family
MHDWRIRTVALPLVVAATALPARTPRDVPSPVIAISAEELERLPAGRTLSAVLASLRCGRQTIPTLIRRPGRAATGRSTLSCVRPADLRMIEIYRLHNATRAQFGSQPLVWDPELAQGALGYSRLLPVRGLVHAPRAGRGAARENLLRARRGRVVTDLAATWIGERRLFRPGVFPNVSINGNWSAVAHYTQMVWPTTTRIGCGITSDARWDWLVCRYLRPGNRDGTYIGPIAPARR